MSNKSYGKKVWFFPDGDLPPPGDVEPKGHESLIILNPNREDARVILTLFFEDKEPAQIDPITVQAQRVCCIRMDKPIQGYRILVGQYAVKLESTVKVICQFGRLDVRQANMAYYTTMGFPG